MITMWLAGSNPVDCLFTNGDPTLPLPDAPSSATAEDRIPSELPAYLIERMQYE